MYVSCRYAPPLPFYIPEGSSKIIICVNEKGEECWTTEDSQVGDFLRFIEAGGTIDPQPNQE